MIEGVISSVDWHIINWPEGDSEHSHIKHVNSGLSGALKDTPIKILGFYSKHHQAIFTHHTTYIHMHLLSNDNNIAGHIDDIIFNGNQILHLPE
jgi:acetolactate decarboxylase